MKFTTPRGDQEFEISDEWWSFCAPETGAALRTAFYIYQTTCDGVTTVPLADVEPPKRSIGIALFKKYKLVPVLLAFQSPECELPPVEVVVSTGTDYEYQVINGVHRYYASVAVGYSRLPVVVRESPHAP